MIQLTQSPFLQALGHAIINSLWQFALIWLLYIMITGVARLSSHIKYVTGFIFQFIGMTWFILTLIFYYRQCVATGNLSSGYLSQLPGTVYQDSFREKLLVALLQAEQFLPYLSIAYLALFAFLAGKWLKAFRDTGKIKTQGLHKMDVDWRLFVQKVAAQMGIKRAVRIYLSESVSSPMTIGFFKPVILIPLATINHLSPQQMEAVLLHELAHIKRFDYLMNIILSIGEAFLFFNPFMQLIRNQIKKERENCCDDWVLQYEYNAATYARALLKLATVQSPAQAFAMHAIDDKKVLLTRVKRMIEKKENTLNYRRQLLALLLLTLILSSIAWLTPAGFQPTARHASQPSPINNERITRVDNPLFNPVLYLASKIEFQDELVAAEKEVKKRLLVNNNITDYLAVQKERSNHTPNLTPCAISHTPLAEKAMVVESKWIPVHVDTSFKTEMKQFFTAAFWKEFEKTEQEVKRVQIAMNALQDETALAVPMAMREVEAGLKMVQNARAEIMQAAAKLKAGKQQENLKRELKNFALHSMSMKHLADEWNKQLDEATKQLSEESKKALMENAIAVYASVNEQKDAEALPPVQPSVTVQPAVMHDPIIHQSENILDNEQAGKDVSPKKPVLPHSPTSVISIRVNEKGKIIKVVKI